MCHNRQSKECTGNAGESTNREFKLRVETCWLPIPAVRIKKFAVAKSNQFIKLK